MEPVKKTELRKQIADFKVQIQIEGVIRSIVEKFKHYKQVNKRFIDAINEIEGYHAWMIKDAKHYIAVSYATAQFLRVKVELFVYGEEFTWDKILKELDRCNFAGQLQRYEDKLKSLDSEVEKLKEIRAYIGDLELSNFSLYSLKSDIEHAIKYSGE